MATVQIDGVSAVTKQSTINDGGAIKANGTTSSGVVSSVSTPRVDLGVFGSVVLDNDTADKALEDGVFRYDNERPIAKKTTTSLSTVDNDYLKSTAGNPGGINSIHKIESVTTRKLTTAIRENKWNEYSGKFDLGFPEVVVDNFGNDKAASPTRQSPGQLIYRDGSANPVIDSYKPKTS
jgi:hypothetical protein